MITHKNTVVVMNLVHESSFCWTCCT